MKLEPGNIWSGSKTISVFTNPTELAFKKGNLSEHYPLKVNSRLYPDVETAYQIFTRHLKDDLKSCTEKCIWLIQLKLRQYPILMEIIRENGGLFWIEKCSHFVGRKPPGRWEGVGLNSLFIKCLYEAFKLEEEPPCSNDKSKE